MSRPLSVLHLVKTSVGAYWALAQMLELVRLGVQVHVALPPGRLVSAYQDAGITVHTLPFRFVLSKPWLSLGTMRDVRDLVADIRPDIIHSHFVLTTLAMRLALGRTHPIPRVFQVAGPLHLEHTYSRWLEVLAAGSADYWIGSCQWTCKRYIKTGIQSGRVFLAYYGFDLDRFAQVKPGKLRQELAAPATKLVGFVSYMYPPKWFLGQTRGIKGHEDFIDAIALASKNAPSIRGVVIGGAWDGAFAYEQQIRAYARHACGDTIVFLGTRNDVLELYPDLDVAVHASHSENVGGAAESLLSAVPTIATNVGGFPDVVRDGETGWLVPPQRPAQLAQAILDALARPERAREMALRGQALARSLLDVRKTARQVLEIYQQIQDCRPRTD